MMIEWGETVERNYLKNLEKKEVFVWKLLRLRSTAIDQ